MCLGYCSEFQYCIMLFCQNHSIDYLLFDSSCITAFVYSVRTGHISVTVMELCVYSFVESFYCIAVLHLVILGAACIIHTVLYSTSPDAL